MARHVAFTTIILNCITWDLGDGREAARQRVDVDFLEEVRDLHILELRIVAVPLVHTLLQRVVSDCIGHV